VNDFRGGGSERPGGKFLFRRFFAGVFLVLMPAFPLSSALAFLALTATLAFAFSAALPLSLPLSAVWATAVLTPAVTGLAAAAGAVAGAVAPPAAASPATAAATTAACLGGNRCGERGAGEQRKGFSFGIRFHFSPPLRVGFVSPFSSKAGCLLPLFDGQSPPEQEFLQAAASPGTAVFMTRLDQTWW